ncbi:hypothetical protein [Lentzea sp. NPDC051838]|uniref:hypothetical protein n=1 Tax=Lentzea sp. NPDC051838 TaxID=3154849 RepID=UPI0034302A0C
MNRSLVLVVLGAALALSACTSTPDSKPAPTPTVPVVTEVVTNTVTNPPKPPADSRLGYGALKLGMTLDEAKATGLAGGDLHVANGGQCSYNENITVSTNGVERIVFPKDAKTSAGIGVGATLEEVKKAYPSVAEESLGYAVEIPGDARLLFETSDTLTPRKLTDKVTKIKLFKRQLACMAAVF